MFRIQNSGREDNEGDDCLISGLFRQSLFIKVYLNPSRYFCARSARNRMKGGHDDIAWRTLFRKQVFPIFFRPRAKVPGRI